MASLLLMPGVAANATEAILQYWPVPINTPFLAEDAIATVETEKAVVDVEAEVDGVILKTLVPPGSTVEVGAPIAILGTPAEQSADLEILMAKLGLLPSTATDGAQASTTEAATAEDMAKANASWPAPSANAAAKRSGDQRLFASPIARKVAREAGIAIESIAGTGPTGRIVRRDVELAVAKQRYDPKLVPEVEAALPVAAPDASRVPASAPSPPTQTPTPAPRPVSSDYTDISHSRIRRMVAERLTHSKRTSPHFYVKASCRVDDLLRLRSELNSVSSIKISVNDLVIKAVATAHAEVPEMNAIWLENAVRRFTHTDISVAIASTRGLVTPVLRSVESMSVSAIATTVKDFARRAGDGKLQQNELEGGSVTVTNLGMFGTEEFAAIINPPQAAILAVGQAGQEPVATNGALAVASVMRVTLSVDHRPIDGAVAAQWMNKFKRAIENPLRIVL